VLISITIGPKLGALQQPLKEDGASQIRRPAITVKVGGYEFEPFVEHGLGISAAFLTLLNGHQNRYNFVFVPIPARRRYVLMQRGAIDAILFEMPRWGWQKHQDDIEVTASVLKASEAFFALKSNAKGLAVFNDLAGSKLALTHGYHYAFADFNADQAYIRSRFDVVFADSQRNVLRHLITGNAAMAVLSDLFLYREFARNPALKDKIIRAPQNDQTYDLPLLVRRGGAISARELTNILDQLQTYGRLKKFFLAFGIEDQLVYRARKP